jgi:glycosyltransferase involved in cell wall biosynthesis
MTDEGKRSHRLSVVIPAWKPQFLDETLRSLSDQTCKEFTVYVGDDCSPSELRTICRKWEHELDIRYHRFPSNLGQQNLTAHWERCIDLGAEEWVWLFGDDDTIDPQCVEMLYREINEAAHPVDVYHFNIRIIDGSGRLVSIPPEFPPLLAATEFLHKTLKGEIISVAPDFVFRRANYQALGKFEHFLKAWCSDHATWIKLGSGHGIKTIGGPKVNWRNSGANISSEHSSDRGAKLRAAISFLCWVNRFVASQHGDALHRKIAASMVPWLVRHRVNLRVTQRELLGIVWGDLRRRTEYNGRLWYSLTLFVIESWRRVVLVPSALRRRCFPRRVSGDVTPPSTLVL